LIVAVNLGGYVGFNVLIQTTWATMGSKPRAVWLLLQTGAVFLNCCVAANGPILYWTRQTIYN
jgi:hypothetical protein